MITKCPICDRSIEANPRYPKAVCQDCADQAVDEQGRQLVFFNEDFSGGFRAEVKKTNEFHDSHICYIRGVMCFADEAYMGGIVILPVEA